MRKYPFTLPAVVLLTAVVYAAFLPRTGLAQQPVVVELFTSEGCSSCPPADSMLITLSHKRDTNIAKLILLEEHVEYWNQGGWVDRFSGPTYTERQADYVKDLHLETSYTPQIVIDGHLQASGNNRAAVQEFILQAAKNPKPVMVALHPVASDKLEVSVDGPADKKLQVLFAVTEDDLTTNVRGGENGGKTLTHSAVVRELHRLGSMSDGKFAKTLDLPGKSGWKKENLRAIVLVQNSNSGEILGAADVPYVPASVQTVGK